MSEIDNTISRINNYEGVERILIIKSSEHDDSQNILVRSQSKNDKKEVNYKDDSEEAQKFAKMIPQIGKEARSMIKQLDSKNDLKFLRIRTKDHEILISPDKDYYLCVVQNLESDLSKNKDKKDKVEKK